MTRIITVAELRENVETDLPESAIQRLIDDADQLVVAAYGANGGATQTDDLAVDPSNTLIFPSRPIDAVTTVTEYTSETLSTTLDLTDYRVGHDGQSLLRLTGGSNPAASWPYRVVVVYVVATTDSPRRRGVVIDLVRLATGHTGLRSQRAGDYSEQSVDYETERSKILGRLGRMGVS